MTISIIEKNESGGTTPNDMESIQITPRDSQVSNFDEIPNFSIFDETHKIRCRLMHSTQNDHIYNFPMGPAECA